MLLDLWLVDSGGIGAAMESVCEGRRASLEFASDLDQGHVVGLESRLLADVAAAECTRLSRRDLID